jgi:hypothetical protein
MITSIMGHTLEPVKTKASIFRTRIAKSDREKETNLRMRDASYHYS